MAVRSKALVWCRLIAGISGLNSAEGMNVRLLCFFCVGSGLCDEPITRSEESCRARARVCVFWRPKQWGAYARVWLLRHRNSCEQII